MDGKKLEGSDSSIWLRYATQYQVNGRTHTIEIGIPVPVGASAETRERLISEAEEGLDQLAAHVNARVAQASQRNTAPQRQANRPITLPTPTQLHTTQPPSPLSPHDQEAVRDETPAPRKPDNVVPMPRPQTAASTSSTSSTSSTATPSTPPKPSTPNNVRKTEQSESGLNLTIGQFVQIIRDRWNITPGKAMELLKVKSLSGLNLGDALAQLENLVEEPSQPLQPAEASRPAPQPIQTSQSSQKPRNANTASTPSTHPPAQAQKNSPSTPSTRPAQPIQPIQFNAKKPPIEEITNAVVRDGSTTYRFVEEEDEDMEDTGYTEDMGDLPDELAYLEELTSHERAIAEERLGQLREAHGSVATSPSRLTVLANVLGEQLNDDQLSRLIDAVWGAKTLKKLKGEQVEELIRWAKTDDFVEEAELVLILLNEEDHARSNR